ncbi:MAG: Ig-like domain-containing protein, partial [Gemmatimonadota bacterium]|nr:Ig-like domain-containing protein [Gemmatimonadota bacterium]
MVLQACIDSVSGPRHENIASVAFQPVLPAGLSTSQFGLHVDFVSIEVRLQDTPDVLVADTTIYFHPDSQSVDLALVLPLRGSSDDFDIDIELANGPSVLFAGSEPVTVASGGAQTSEINIETVYVGPGSDIARLQFLPGDTVVTFGDEATFAVLAFDRDENPVEEFYVSWSTSSAVASINAQGLLRAPEGVRGSVFVLAMTPSEVIDSVEVLFAPVPTGLTLSTAGVSSVGVGDSLQLAAFVDAEDGLGVPGVPVRFAADAAVGIDTVVLTDSIGIASLRAPVGTQVGEFHFFASCDSAFSGCASADIGDTVAVTAMAGAPKAIENISGFDHVYGEVGLPVPESLSVRVLDRYGNPVPGARVTWNALGSAGTFSPDTSFTDDSGVAGSQWTLGTTAGNLSSSAVIQTGVAVSYTATAAPGPAVGILEISGGEQSATVGSALPLPLAVQVVDRYGNFVEGEQVEFLPMSGGSVADPTVVTDANGRAATRASLGTGAGVHSFQAVGPNDATVTFNASALADVAAEVAITSGDGQTGVVGRQLPNPLEVTVTDRFGNPVVGQLVNFVITSGGGSMWAGSANTDSNGRAADYWTLGTDVSVENRVEARAVEPDGSGGYSRIVFLSFLATPLPDVPNSAEIISGNGQVDVVGAQLGDTLAVRVFDKYGNSVGAGVPVEWNAGSGTVIPVSTETDSVGIARALWTLGTVAGTQTAVMSVGSAVSLGFESQVLAGPVASVVPNADSISFSSFGETASLSASAFDQYGNVNPAATFTWVSANPAIAGVDAAGQVTANGNGFTEILAQVGSVSSVPVTVEVSQRAASVELQPGSVSFEALGDTATILAVSKDSRGNPISGATLSWMSSDGTIAIVDGGSVTAVGVGTATVYATSEGVTGSALVTVDQVVSSVTVTPSAVTLTTLGESTVLSASAADQNGYVVPGAVFMWTTSDEAVAGVDVSGAVTAIGNGTATITAQSGGVSASVTVVVTIASEPPPSDSPVASISVLPA